MNTLLRPALGAAGTAIALVLSGPAGAAELYNSGSGTVVEGTVEVGMAAFAVSNAAFGATTSFFGEPLPDTDPTWVEGYVKPGVVVTQALGANAGTLFGGLSAVASATRGDGDAAGLTPGDPEDVDLEDAYVGWRSGTAFEALGEDAITLSAGRQAFQVGDGFVISSGYVDQGKDGAFWLAPRKAFSFAGVASLDTNGFHADLFHLRTDNTIDVIPLSLDTKGTGANVSYTKDGMGTVGAMYMRLTDSDVALRDGMDVYNLRASGTPFPDLPGLALSGEWVQQRNDSMNQTENGWYSQVGYTFTETPWSPTLSYRYASFDSGYDSLFYGFNGWGTWFMGEIVGEYVPGNTNQNIHMLHASAQPLENVGVGVIGYRFDLNNPAAYGVTAKHFADEINVYADWGVNDNLYVAALAGMAFPGDAARQWNPGADETTKLVQVLAIVAF